MPDEDTVVLPLPLPPNRPFWEEGESTPETLCAEEVEGEWEGVALMEGEAEGGREEEDDRESLGERELDGEEEEVREGVSGGVPLALPLIVRLPDGEVDNNAVGVPLILMRDVGDATLEDDVVKNGVPLAPF